MEREEWFDHYASDNSTFAKQQAIGILNAVTNDSQFMHAGHRNNQAVNFCIALHVLGHDPKKALADWRWQDSANDHFLFGQHVNRVCDYLDSWGPEGKEDLALDYIL